MSQRFTQQQNRRSEVQDAARELKQARQLIYAELLTHLRALTPSLNTMTLVGSEEQATAFLEKYDPLVKATDAPISQVVLLGSKDIRDTAERMRTVAWLARCCLEDLCIEWQKDVPLDEEIGFIQRSMFDRAFEYAALLERFQFLTRMDMTGEPPELPSPSSLTEIQAAYLAEKGFARLWPAPKRRDSDGLKEPQRRR